MTEQDFTKAQEALIQRIAYEVGDVIADRLEKKMTTAMELHEAKCPGRRVGKGSIALWGVICAALASAATATIIKAITGG